MNEHLRVPDDLSWESGKKSAVHELAYDQMEVFNNEFRMACYHLEKFVGCIRDSIGNDIEPNIASSLIHLDFGVAHAFVMVEHDDDKRWQIQIAMLRPDVAGQG